MVGDTDITNHESSPSSFKTRMESITEGKNPGGSGNISMKNTTTTNDGLLDTDRLNPLVFWHCCWWWYLQTTQVRLSEKEEKVVELITGPFPAVSKQKSRAKDDRPISGCAGR